LRSENTVVLVDDLGFAGTSAFGGSVDTPTFDQIANAGLPYNNFHTTAVCSPTRAALKSGRNHHVANMGSIIETGTAFPGNTGQIPNEVAPVAEMSTAKFGAHRHPDGLREQLLPCGVPGESTRLRHGAAMR